MALIKKKDIETLVNVENQNDLCISIYIPTHRGGAEVLNNQDAILFKNKIKEAEALLQRHDLTEAEAEAMMKPAHDLQADSGFWRHQGEGLAVFITKSFTRHYTLPIAVKENVYVLDNFYLTPLVPMLSQNGRFFILSLNRDKVCFYEATVERIRAIDVKSFVPETMNKALKFDLKGNDQDFTHSTTTVNGTNIVHGPGATKGDEEHERVREFMLEIDNGLQKILHDEHEPLVLAGTDHYCGIFRNISKYKNIVPQNVNVNENTDVFNKNKLHEKALELVKPLMHQEHTDWLDRYQNVVGTGKASDDVVQVATNAIHGRVDTLFITPGEPVWGTYDEKSATAVVHDNYHRGDYDLVNLAAVKTLTQGGRVFMADYNGLTEAGVDGKANVKALFRY